MKPLRTLLTWLLLTTPALCANVVFYTGTTGRTDLAVYVQTATNTYVSQALTEGDGTTNGSAVGQYFATEAQLVSAGVSSASTGNGFPYVVRDTDDSSAVTSTGYLPWSGSAELMPPTDSRAWAGTATASDDSALASVASWVSSLLGTTNGAATVATQLQHLDADVSEAGGGGGDPVSPYLVDPDHTWRFDTNTQVTAPNSLTENIGFVGLLQMDFTQPLPALGSISSITTTSVADVGGATEPTISESAVSADKKKVVLTVNCASATAATYTFTVKIQTTDSQTIVRKGRLVVQ